MLTPAEEQGLAGLALASRVQHALYRLAPAELAGIIERLRAGALAHHVVYLHEGEVEPIRILPAPITILPDQLAYVHHVTLTVQNALKRLPALYLGDFSVREILRLPDAEEAWLRECWGREPDEATTRSSAGSTRWSTSPARCGRSRSGSSSRTSWASADSTWCRPASG